MSIRNFKPKNAGFGAKINKNGEKMRTSVFSAAADLNKFQILNFKREVQMWFEASVESCEPTGYWSPLSFRNCLNHDSSD